MRQLTVLLVEDNSRDVRLIQRVFTQAGFSHDLRIVGDGDDALTYLAGKGADAEPDTAPRPDLILLDLNLPRMSGHEVLRQCKQHDRLKQIPIPRTQSLSTREVQANRNAIVQRVKPWEKSPTRQKSRKKPLQKSSRQPQKDCQEGGSKAA